MLSQRLGQLFRLKVLTVKGDKIAVRVQQIHYDGMVNKVVIRLICFGVIHSVLPGRGFDLRAFKPAFEMWRWQMVLGILSMNLISRRDAIHHVIQQSWVYGRVANTTFEN